MSRKRKIEALGADIASAALSDMVSRGIGAMVGKLEERRQRAQDMDDGEEEVERLDTLVTVVRAAVEAAEGVHIRNWWLRRWLWKLRDAAFEGAAAVRSSRRRAAEQSGHGGGAREEGPWWARMLRSAARSLLFFSRDGSGASAQLRRDVRRLEELAGGIGDFLKLLERETRVESSPPPLRRVRRMEPLCLRVAMAGRKRIPDGGLEVVSEPQESPPPSPKRAATHDLEILCDEFSAAHMDGASGSGSKPGLDLDRCVSGVIGFAVGARLIWFAFQVGSRVLVMRGQGGPAAR